MARKSRSVGRGGFTGSQESECECEYGARERPAAGETIHIQSIGGDDRTTIQSVHQDRKSSTPPVKITINLGTEPTFQPLSNS
jgi:hypothetical protein